MELKNIGTFSGFGGQQKRECSLLLCNLYQDTRAVQIVDLKCIPNYAAKFGLSSQSHWSISSARQQ